MKRQHSSGCNLNIQVQNPILNQQGNQQNSNFIYNSKENLNHTHNYSHGHVNNAYSINKVQTLCAESYRNSGMDDINFGAIFSSSQEKPTHNYTNNYIVTGGGSNHNVSSVNNKKKL